MRVMIQKHMIHWLLSANCLLFVLTAANAAGTDAEEQLQRKPILRLLRSLSGEVETSPKPQWIWTKQATDEQTCWFRRDILLKRNSLEKTTLATLYFVGDDAAKVLINGRPVKLRRSSSKPWSFLVASIESLLKPGTNSIAISCRNSVGNGGVIAVLEVKHENGAQTWVTDNQWKLSQELPVGWPHCKTDGPTWQAAHMLGPVGIRPWGKIAGYPIQRIPITPAHLNPVQQIEFDWLLQDRRALSPRDDAGAAARLRALALEHHQRASQIMQAISVEPKQVDLSAERLRWQTIKEKLAQTSVDQQEEPRSLELYLTTRRLKRDILLKHPLLDFKEILFAKGLYPRSLHEQSHRLSKTAVPGGGLFVLSGLSPAGKLRELTSDLPHGSYWRPDLSFDGRRLLFCYKSEAKASFQLHQMNIDGSNLRKLTDSPFDDLDPIYLPSGRILFTSTRGQTYVRCNPESRSFVLCTAEADGSQVRIISHNSEPDWTPAIMDDGRVLFTRWEYTDRALWRLQKLWTVRPDGTNVDLYWGNHSEKPDALVEARQIPGSRRVVFSGVGHHHFFQGSLGILDPSKGLDYPHGLTHLTAEVSWPEVEKDRDTGAYKSPYPLSDHLFLVSYGHNSTSYRPGGADFGIYILDDNGNKELVFRDPAFNSWYAMPVRARVRPPVLTNVKTVAKELLTQQEPATGTFVNPDVYEGLKGVTRGQVKHMRVIELDYKTYSGHREYLFQNPPISSHFVESVKRIRGTVPVEKDGSVSVKVPAGRALYFQLLDENYRALQTMRSFVGLQKGEVRGCTGCHSRGHKAAPITRTSPLAMNKPAKSLTPPPWGEQTVGYTRFVQPVLERHCVSCHHPGKEAKSKLDLTYRKTRFFAEPYLTLIDRQFAGVYPSEPAYWKTRARDVYDGAEPGEHLSPRSLLVNYASSGKHYGVKVDAAGLRRLVAWVDMNGPFLGREEVLKRYPKAPRSER